MTEIFPPKKRKSTKKKKNQRDGRKFSVKNIKATYNREKSKAERRNAENVAHVQSGIIHYVNTDKDISRRDSFGDYSDSLSSHVNRNQRIDPHVQYTHMKSAAKVIPQRRSINEKSKSSRKTGERALKEGESNILNDSDDWVDIFSQDQDNYYENLVGIAEGEKESAQWAADYFSGGKIPLGSGSNVQESTVKIEPVDSSRKRQRSSGSNKRSGKNKRKRSTNRRKKRDVTIKQEDSSSYRTTWTPFNTDVSEWIKDIVSLNRLEAKRKKMNHVCDYLATSGEFRAETLRKKKGQLRNIIKAIKQSSHGIENCFKELKSLNGKIESVNMDLLIDSLAKLSEYNANLEKRAEDFVAYAKSVENTHNLQESFVLNLKAHSLELDKKTREAVMRFLAHVPSHKYTDEDHENRVLASSMFQLKEWTAGRYGRPAIGVTAKKTAHVTKFGQLLNMDISDSYIPCFPDI